MLAANHIGSCSASAMRSSGENRQSRVTASKSAGARDVAWPCNAEHPQGTERLYEDLTFWTDIDACESYGADFLTGGVLKWLCGGPGAAFLWMKPSLRRRLRPRITGWMAHRTPFAFEQNMRYAGGPERFLGGTPAIPALYAAREDGVVFVVQANERFTLLAENPRSRERVPSCAAATRPSRLSIPSS